MLLGFRIVSHSVRQLFGNGRAVLRIFLLPIMLTFAAMNLLELEGLFSVPATHKAIDGGYFPWRATGAWLLIAELLFLWCAVAWHRFVLLNEAPGFPFVPPRPVRALAYFLRTIWTLFLLAVPLLIVLVVIAGLTFRLFGEEVFAPTNKMYYLSTSLISWPVTAVFLRLLTSLPAAALGVPGSVRQTWIATRSQLPTLLIVSGSVLLFKHVTTWLMSAASVGTETASGAAIRVTVYWMGWMLLLSVLTTLYGYYIEKRPLT